MKNFIRVLYLSLCITGFGLVPAPVNAQESAEVRTIATTEATEYSQREHAAPALGDFQGGVVDTLAVILLVLLILILV